MRYNQKLKVIGPQAMYADWERVSGAARMFYVNSACQTMAGHAELGRHVPREPAARAEFGRRVRQRMAGLFRDREYQQRKVSTVFGHAFVHAIQPRMDTKPHE